MSNCREIPLWAVDGSVKAVALVDRGDHERLSAHRWHLISTGYAARRTTAGTVLMHRELLGLTVDSSLEADHINRDKLDNRRANLRVATRSQNAQNTQARRGGTSRHRGVCWDKRDRVWRAQAQLNGRNVYIGGFKSEADAADAASAWRAQHMPFSEDARSAA
jgi:hypothetical protein